MYILKRIEQSHLYMVILKLNETNIDKKCRCEAVFNHREKRSSFITAKAINNVSKIHFEITTQPAQALSVPNRSHQSWSSDPAFTISSP